MPPPASRWKASRSRGIQKNDKKGSEAPTGASEPLFTIGAVTATSQFSADAPLSQNYKCFSAKNAQQRRRPPPVAETGRSCWGSGQQDASAAQGTMRMLGAATRKTRRAFKSLYPPKGAQDHIRAISASTSSMRVAQLVAMRTTVWVSSNFSQKPNFALPSSAASWAFSSTRKTWFVGESMKKR